MKLEFFEQILVGTQANIGQFHQLAPATLLKATSFTVPVGGRLRAG